MKGTLLSFVTSLDQGNQGSPGVCGWGLRKGITLEVYSSSGGLQYSCEQRWRNLEEGDREEWPVWSESESFFFCFWSSWLFNHLRIERSRLRLFRKLIRMPPGSFRKIFWVHPTHRRPQGKTRTLLTDFIHHLPCELLRIPRKELENTVGKRDASAAFLTPLPLWPDFRWASENGWIGRNCSQVIPHSPERLEDTSQLSYQVFWFFYLTN